MDKPLQFAVNVFLIGVRWNRTPTRLNEVSTRQRPRHPRILAGTTKLHRLSNFGGSLPSIILRGAEDRREFTCVEVSRRTQEAKVVYIALMTEIELSSFGLWILAPYFPWILGIGYQRTIT